MDRERSAGARRSICETVRGIGVDRIVGHKGGQFGRVRHWSWALVASGVGAGLLLWLGRPLPPAAPSASASASASASDVQDVPLRVTEAYRLPVAKTQDAAVVQARLSRGVPPSVLATADVQAAPWAPGLRLVETKMQGAWAQHRAVIEDTKTADARSYAIGDLLPHGSLLVGISTGAAQVLVADVELVEINSKGKLRSLSDFRTAYEARPLKRVSGLAPDYVQGAQQTLQATLGGDNLEIQRAIDDLIAAGEPAIDLIISAVDSDTPVLAHDYVFAPTVGVRRPRVQGDIVVGVLEAITGQSFGNVFGADVSAADRRQVARAWKRWWGVD